MKKNGMTMSGSWYLFISLVSLLVQDTVLSEYEWHHRVIILQSDSARHQYQEELRLLEEALPGLEERDLVIFHLFEDHGYDPKQNLLSQKELDYLLKTYGSTDKSFRFSLIGKDGGLKFTSDKVVKPQELFAIIDRMPMRRREMKIKQ